MKYLKRKDLKPGVQYIPIGLDGEPVVGTYEKIFATALVHSVEVEGAGLSIGYTDQTDVNWDSQETLVREGRRLWVQADGHTIPENKLRYVENQS